MKTFSHLWQYLSEFFLEWEMFQIKVVKKSKHILCSVTFFRKSCRLLDNVENMVEPERAQMTVWRHVACWIIKDTPARARTHTNTLSHIHTYTTMCNTYCFSTATMVSWTRLVLTLYVHCLSCCPLIYMCVCDSQASGSRLVTVRDWTDQRL
jgi:hypothetical protein